VHRADGWSCSRCRSSVRADQVAEQRDLRGEQRRQHGVFDGRVGRHQHHHVAVRRRLGHDDTVHRHRPIAPQRHQFQHQRLQHPRSVEPDQRHPGPVPLQWRHRQNGGSGRGSYRYYVEQLSRVAIHDAVSIDYRSRPLFSISQGTLPWQSTLWKSSKLRTFVALAFRNGMGYCHVYVWLNSATNATMSCKIWEQLNGYCVACSCRGLAYFVEYLRMYWTYFRIIYTVWKRFTCRWWICPYFPICQGTLPWQPNNFAVMKANWYYVHSLYVC